MKVLIIGAGFTGLACGIELVDRGFEVEIWEKNGSPGGLAAEFDSGKWNWSLEKFYHHIFANDEAIIGMAKKVGLPPFWRVPKTDSFVTGEFYQLDSALSLLKFGGLKPWERVRMGLGLAALKMTPNGLFLERYRVVDLLPLIVGRRAYEVIWLPLLKAKFGSQLDKVNLAWFWARMYKRTKKLGYFKAGFGKLADRMVGYLKKKGAKIRLGYEIKSRKEIEKGGFDRVVITTPAPIAEKILGKGKIDLPKVDYLWGQTLVLEMEKSLMDCYWLNILEKDWPFLVVVEQTNFVDSKNYDGKHVVYLGNYLEEDDGRLKLDKESLIELYLPYLQKLNPNFEKEWISRAWKFEEPFAQPVFGINYSKKLPGMKTGREGWYMANMSMVYPWDRGTNYAVAAGKEVAKLVVEEAKK